MNKTKGLTLQIVFGQWCKPHFRKSDKVYGFCIGWISFSIIIYDIECIIVNLAEQKRNLSEELKDLNTAANHDIHEKDLKIDELEKQIELLTKPKKSNRK